MKQFEVWLGKADALHVLGNGTVKIYPSEEDLMESCPEAKHPDYKPIKVTITIPDE